MDFIATVDDKEIGRIHEIAGSLEKIGVKVNAVLRSLGTITGSTNGNHLNHVKISGIKSVAVQRQLSVKKGI